MRLDEWICDLDEARKEVNVYQGPKKWGSYRLITGLKSYCKRCMHPCVDESLCYWHFEDELIDKTFALDVYCPVRMGSINLMTYHIRELKDNKEFSKPISCAMIECLTRDVFPLLKLDNIGYLVPVPKHPDEYKVDILTKERYNQAEILAHNIANNIRIEMLDALRKKSPFSLRTMGREERRILARINYEVKIEIEDKLEDKEILLIDDVRTSGSTGDACATALKSAGADKVYLYVAGRDVIPEVCEKCLKG